MFLAVLWIPDQWYAQDPTSISSFTITLVHVYLWAQCLSKHYWNHYLKEKKNDYNIKYKIVLVGLFVLKFYGPVNPIGSYQAQSVYVTTLLLGRLSPLIG